MYNSLYKEEILEHYQHPLNFGQLTTFNVSSKQLNSFCGDEIELFILVKNKKVQDIRFLGKGCAISIAATSLLTDFAKGNTLFVLTKFSEKDMLNLLGIEISQTRKKCALLGWSVLQDCLYGIKSKSR